MSRSFKKKIYLNGNNHNLEKRQLPHSFSTFMLPNEILTIIFSYLEKKQLLQCQLTNEQWRKASLKQLYSKVKVTSDVCYKQYIVTVSTYPYLALYLKSIDLGHYFAKQKEDAFIRTYEILFNFPNITKLSATEPTLEFWTQLSYGADQGRFKYLEYIPIPSAFDFEYYAYAALLLRKTLTTLVFEGSTNTNAYNSLITHISHFKCLTSVYIKRSKNCGLSHYDTVLNHCSNQKYVKAGLSVVHANARNRGVYTYHSHPSNNNVVIQNPPLLIQPHNNAESLECHWELIGFDNQLNYTIKKFPALKSLTISLYSKEAIGLENIYNREEYTPSPHPSVNTLVNFVEYLFTIKTFDAILVLSFESISSIWGTLTEIKRANDNVRLVFDLKQSFAYTNNLATKFKRDQTIVYLNYYTCLKEELPGKDFLDQVGKYIGSLQIRNEGCLRTNVKLSKIYRDPNYIHKLLYLCPSLVVLDFDTIFTAKKMYSIYNYHFPLRSLSVNISHAKPYVLFLKKLALDIPSLKQLHFNIWYKQHIEHRRQIKIEMPNIDFDLITWNYKTKSRLTGQDIRCYLQIKTFSKVKFFIANLDGLLPISKYAYLSARSQLRIFIVCKELRDFRLKFSTITL